MAEVLRIAGNVATPLGLVGLVAAIALFAYYRYLKSQEQQLQHLPEGDRARSVDTWLTRYRLSAENLTREQKYDLLCREMDRRADRIKFLAVTVAVVFVICVLAYVASAIFVPIPKPDPVPSEFAFETCKTADDPRLPDSLLGARDDDIGMPRQWMRIIDAGGPSRLKVQNMLDCLQFWLLTNEFAGRYSGFEAYIYGGTPDKVLICGFLVRPDRNNVESHTRFFPLKRSQDRGTPGLYVFNVPDTEPGDRLLVSLAMKKSSFDAILPDQKFRIRSRSLP